jgi:hypothetical protein
MACANSKFEKYAIRWLTFFSILCVVNSVLVIVFGVWNFNGYLLAFILPFINMAIIVVFYMLFSFYKYFCQWIHEDEWDIMSPLLMWWPFLLTLIIWAFNLLLIALLGWHWPH